jgi:hypothetical protein
MKATQVTHTIRVNDIVTIPEAVLPKLQYRVVALHDDGIHADIERLKDGYRLTRELELMALLKPAMTLPYQVGHNMSCACVGCPKTFVTLDITLTAIRCFPCDTAGCVASQDCLRFVVQPPEQCTNLKTLSAWLGSLPPDIWEDVDLTALPTFSDNEPDNSTGRVVSWDAHNVLVYESYGVFRLMPRAQWAKGDEGND